MPFVIDTYDKPDNHALRLQVRPKHLAFLEENKAHLLACGAKLDDAGQRASGGVYVVDFETRADAEQFIAQDPFTKAELFERVEITRWRAAYFNRQSRIGQGGGQRGRGQGGGGGRRAAPNNAGGARGE